jgi:methylmalonyl-CoA/ethylmalonyl-CoA epimerase
LKIDRLDRAFLGNMIEICFVTHDYRRTMTGLAALGIGPWRVYTFSPENVSDQTYMGQPAVYRIKVCFAEVGNMVYEIMQPLDGPTIFQEFLDVHGEGIHHVAFDCNGIPWDERIAGFAERGFRMAQSGVFAGGNRFAFFTTEVATTTIIETIHFPDGFVFPEPEELYPGVG